MNRILVEFRDFVMRGNIVDLAVAFIAGVAFSAVVNSLVSDVIMQIVAAVAGKPDFTALSVTLNGSEIRYGAFLTVLINFLLTMAAVFFLLVKPVNALTVRLLGPEDASAPAQRECPHCLSQVRAAARRCAFCTSDLQPVA
jgi:large conductance mechanosensitive channel